MTENKITVGELLKLVDETIADLKVAIVANQQRAFESPHTSFEFTQRAIELQEDLDDLTKIRDVLSSLDPDAPLESHFKDDELEKLLQLMELLRKSKSHLY